jgi:SH3-like domain-containing protein
MSSMRSALCAIGAAALLLAAPVAGAVEFRSVGASPTILYDGPSAKGGKLYVAPRGMPVEVVLSYGDWVKVRDMNGDLTWAEAKMLSPRRTVVVKSASAKVRASADDSSAVVLTADRGVLLELSDTTPAVWLKVRHKDGVTGYIKAVDVWGI